MLGGPTFGGDMLDEDSKDRGTLDGGAKDGGTLDGDAKHGGILDEALVMSS